MIQADTLKPGWQIWRFDQIATNVNDRINDPSKAETEYYVGLEHLDSDSLKIRRWGSPSDVEATKLCFRKGDIIFGRRRVYQRKVAVADFDGICSAHALVLRAKPEVILPEFLPFFMQSDVFMERAKAISVGSLSPTINWKTLAKEEFALPPLKDQEKLLKVAVSLRENLQAYDNTVITGYTLENAWLKNRLEKISKMSPIARATEVLEHLTVGIVVKPAKWYVDPPNGVPALRSINVQPHKMNFNDLVYISLEGHSIHEKSQLISGDVVIVRTGRPGDAAVIPEGLGLLNCIDLIIARPKSCLLPTYLAAVINSPFGRKQIAKGIAGTAQQHFNVGSFKDLKFPLPPIEEQRSFITEYDLISQTINKLTLRYEQNKALYRSALQKLFLEKE
ncbi:restriction endonuclease subunit S [Anabaena lutea]|uniref:Restriction endonuclease subunit S n=1 Tax=Anabaena lutea FACHB-196 TaxID=2692881 RepID=A0ABR8FEG1_9NOST|nr:restriction endonuclease subunit S [Anabaena lutea]MBD2568230.1 restriction endonuclease subunit S [Anabaena lutea FACHB-196]